MYSGVLSFMDPIYLSGLSQGIRGVGFLNLWAFHF